jgi:predicted SAM-dependent methyltransferase
VHVTGQPVRYDIGAGNRRLDGFIPVDRRPVDGNPPGEAYPLSLGGVPVPEAAADEIRASHVLEHFGHGLVPTVLAHWASRLKPGGRLRIAVPDFEWIARRYLDGEPINTQGYVMGGQTHADDFHATVFDRELLAELLIEAGLERIGPWVSDAADDASLPVSLNLEGTRPAGPADLSRTTAILSAPRFGPVMHFACAHRAFAGLRIPYQIGQGAYWHQVLAELIERQVADGGELILTLDYDTVFTAEDVRRLHRILTALPELDAVCALQMKRARATALLSLVDADGKARDRAWRAEFDRAAVRVATGHFGCTLFRAAALRSLPRPWFVPTPDAAGRWGDERTDADIAFWQAWAAAGLTVAVAPRVPVGHLAETIIWPGAGLSPVFQATADYNEDGRPAGLMGDT